jgi:hypothetical protein
LGSDEKNEPPPLSEVDDSVVMLDLIGGLEGLVERLKLMSQRYQTEIAKEAF